MKLIDLHKKWMRKGVIPFIGLCDSLPHEYSDAMGIFEPTGEDSQTLLDEGFCKIFWASGVHSWHPQEHDIYSPLRQTIVLLICAMNNEL